MKFLTILESHRKQRRGEKVLNPQKSYHQGSAVIECKTNSIKSYNRFRGTVRPRKAFTEKVFPPADPLPVNQWISPTPLYCTVRNQPPTNEADVAMFCGETMASIRFKLGQEMLHRIHHVLV